jgi:hypothetical protein
MKKINAQKRLNTFKRYLTANQRGLPDFIIIGAQKCATTSLYRYLSEHSDIAPCLGEKEPDYFEKHHKYGLRWYHSNFPEKDPSKQFFEASTNYIFHPLVPERVSKLLPDVKLILLLRNPVERAYSHYHHQIRTKCELLSFEEAIAKEPERLAGTENEIIEKTQSFNYNHRNFSYLERGLYCKQLKRWQQYFPKDQFSIHSTEDLIAQPQKTIDLINGFIGISHQKLNTEKVYNQGKHKDKMSPKIRAELIDFFKPHNQELYEYLGKDFGWN